VTAIPCLGILQQALQPEEVGELGRGAGLAVPAGCLIRQWLVSALLCFVPLPDVLQHPLDYLAADIFYRQHGLHMVCAVHVYLQGCCTLSFSARQLFSTTDTAKRLFHDGYPPLHTH
jgi:hypothetical protein